VISTTQNNSIARQNKPMLGKASLPALIALICFTLFACTNHAELEGSAPSIVFKTLTGDDIELQKVGKPLVVNFWSTRCGICLAEMPELTALYKEYKAKGFEMVMVAGPNDLPNEVLELAETNDWPFPVALDIGGKVDAAFGKIKGTPTRFVIDKNGEYVARSAGRIKLEKFKKQLDKLI